MPALVKIPAFSLEKDPAAGEIRLAYARRMH
jgi:hypothetical protein